MPTKHRTTRPSTLRQKTSEKKTTSWNRPPQMAEKNPTVSTILWSPNWKPFAPENRCQINAVRQPLCPRRFILVKRLFFRTNPENTGLIRLNRRSRDPLRCHECLPWHSRTSSGLRTYAHPLCSLSMLSPVELLFQLLAFTQTAWVGTIPPHWNYQVMEDHFTARSAERE